MIAAKLYSPDDASARRSARRPVALDGTVRDSDSAPLDVEVADLAEHGFRASLPKAFDVGEIVRLGLSGVGIREARVVWRNGREHGCAFVAPLAAGQVERAMIADTVVAMPFGEALPGPLIADDRLPGWLRLSILVLVPPALWAGLAFAGSRLLG